MSIPTDRMRLINYFADLVKQHHGKPEKILDLGCGATHTVWKQIYGTRYEGLDVNPDFNADYTCDACDLSMFESNSRDVVTSWSSIEHMTNPYGMLSEMKRVSSGTVLFTTDYTERDKNRSSNHLYSWTEKTLKQLVKKIHRDCKVYVERRMLIGVMYNCGEKEQ